jgi:hypothetical protein
MDLAGKISGCNWTVAGTSARKSDGFGCQINTNIAGPEGNIARGFAHDQTFRTPQEAVQWRHKKVNEDESQDRGVTCPGGR